MAASDWVARVSISASSARTESASTSSSRNRAARCIRAARDCRRLCSRRDRRFSLGRSDMGRILKKKGERVKGKAEKRKREKGERAKRVRGKGHLGVNLCLPHSPFTLFPRFFGFSDRG